MNTTSFKNIRSKSSLNQAYSVLILLNLEKP